MAEDIYAKPDLTKKVRFQTGEKDDRPTDVCDNVDTVRIYDNCWAEESAPPDKSQDDTAENQPQTTSVNVSPEKRSRLGAAAASLGLLCLLLLVAVIALVVVLILETNRLWGDNACLTSERDKLQTSYSQVKILNHNLTQTTRQLEEENSNLTKTVDELQKQIETTFCPANWITFGKSCYLMSTSEKSWTDSRQACEAHNAQLVIISNGEEQVEVGKKRLVRQSRFTLPEMYKKGKRKSAATSAKLQKCLHIITKFISSFNPNSWIGLTDEGSEDHWKWVDEKPLTIEYWGPNQPDNKGPHGRDENCAQISNGYSNLDNWNDLLCSRKLYFTCEKILE